MKDKVFNWSDEELVESQAELKKQKYSKLQKQKQSDKAMSEAMQLVS